MTDLVDWMLDALGKKSLPAWRLLHPRTAASLLRLEAVGALSRKQARELARVFANLGVRAALAHKKDARS